MAYKEMELKKMVKRQTCTSKWRIPSFLFAASRTTANASANKITKAE